MIIIILMLGCIIFFGYLALLGFVGRQLLFMSRFIPRIINNYWMYAIPVIFFFGIYRIMQSKKIVIGLEQTGVISLFVGFFIFAIYLIGEHGKESYEAAQKEKSDKEDKEKSYNDAIERESARFNIISAKNYFSKMKVELLDAVKTTKKSYVYAINPIYEDYFKKIMNDNHIPVFFNSSLIFDENTNEIYKMTYIRSDHWNRHQPSTKDKKIIDLLKMALSTWEDDEQVERSINLERVIFFHDLLDVHAIITSKESLQTLNKIRKIMAVDKV